MRFLFVLVLVIITLHAQDVDFDGVEDDVDNCLATPFLDLVDEHGCPISTLDTSFYSSFTVVSTQNSQETYAHERTDYYLFSTEYRYKQFYLYGVIGKYINAGNEGMTDTVLGVGYHEYINEYLRISPYAALILPTYKSGYSNEKSDVQVGVEYYYDLFAYSLFGAISYTFVNDEDVESIKYQNYFSALMGIGMKIESNIDLNVDYSYSQTLYENVEDTAYFEASLQLLTENGFIYTLSNSMGMTSSSSDYIFLLRVGYTF